MNGINIMSKLLILMLLLLALGMTDRVLHLWAIIPSSSPVRMTVTGIPLTVYLSIARQVVELGCLGASALAAVTLIRATAATTAPAPILSLREIRELFMDYPPV